jgi:methionyl-tRNA formyltransferase
MRMAFMGSPDFAVVALRALVADGHDIAAVYCQPPRPAGRGQSVRLSPVHAAAESLGLPVRHPARLRRGAPDWERHWAEFDALDLDIAIVAAYGLILPSEMLTMPRRGCLNIHASLLPRWRGAAPIQAAILAGDSESGVTIMQMDAGLDTGAMLLRGSVPITSQTTATTLHDALATLGAELVLRTLHENPPAVPQPERGVTYAAKLTREDGVLHWTDTNLALDRRIRALNPWPGTSSTWAPNGTPEPLKILAATPQPGQGQPGAALDDRLLIATGEGALRITRLQAQGRPAMSAEAFLNGRKIPAGTVLG